jgi:hypothetical protein
MSERPRIGHQIVHDCDALLLSTLHPQGATLAYPHIDSRGGLEGLNNQKIDVE